MAVQVSFRAHLEDTEQSGLLAYVGNTHQHISLTLGRYSSVLLYYWILEIRENDFFAYFIFTFSP